MIFFVLFCFQRFIVVVFLFWFWFFVFFLCVVFFFNKLCMMPSQNRFPNINLTASITPCILSP